MPLKEGIDDEGYQSIFCPVLRSVVQFYQPAAVVLQCGADSLAGDRLGNFNLSLRGHGECVAAVGEGIQDTGCLLMVVGAGPGPAAAGAGGRRLHGA